jgi:hypothetical protein
MKIRKEDVKTLVGKNIYAVKKDGMMVTGKLVSVKGNRLKIQYEKGKKVRTKAFLPLLLTDLLATGPFGGFGAGVAPFGTGFGGFGTGFGGFGTGVSPFGTGFGGFGKGVAPFGAGLGHFGHGFGGFGPFDVF